MFDHYKRHRPPRLVGLTTKKENEALPAVKLVPPAIASLLLKIGPAA
jgi:hypothetical protein